MSETPAVLVVGARASNVVGMVSDAGLHAVGTTDPWEAIVIASRRPLSLIILDPEVILGDGADFYTLLREDPCLQDVPVIFTAEEDLLPAIRRLVSPFPPEVPVAREERFVFRRRMPQMV
jgi:hypothetical protein